MDKAADKYFNMYMNLTLWSWSPGEDFFFFLIFPFFVTGKPTGLDSRLLSIGLDNCQTNLILFGDANPNNKKPPVQAGGVANVVWCRRVLN
jgi:hypothetical protein